ncbi:amidohydrolase [Lophium mytilinum]|uniref:Amidohydrolase n=1 Tax=Lophium mytilinum TaxID=390894 RepID=A0A6A6QLW4_9PEZI|nr:amidohydrolase [Lophium mytilinum]
MPVFVNPLLQDPTLTLITTDLLIPGRGTPTKATAIILSSKTNKIVFVGPIPTLPSKYTHLPCTHVPVLLPGLWDCHCHFHGAKTLNLTPIATTHPATAGARLARSAADTLAAGFTSVRELGGYAPEIASAIDDGIIPGPTIYSAGAALSQTAGHGDLFDLPVGWVWQCQGVGAGISPLCVADGVEECRKAVRLQIRRGAKVIKVLASGGVLSIADNPLYQQFSDEELKVIVEEAGRAHRVVAAHVHGKEGVMAALRAGVKTLEHGTYLDEEAMEVMKERDVILVATRTIVKEAVKNKDLMSPESAKKMMEVIEQSDQMYAAAIKVGVKIALGTDLGISTPGQGLSHGNNGGEFAYAVESGMTPLEAIEAGTASAPETLGPQAPLSGQIREGYDADVIAVVGNPLENVKVLGSAKNISHVWKRGELLKSPS